MATTGDVLLGAIWICHVAYWWFCAGRVALAVVAIHYHQRHIDTCEAELRRLYRDHAEHVRLLAYAVRTLHPKFAGQSTTDPDPATDPLG